MASQRLKTRRRGFDKVEASPVLAWMIVSGKVSGLIWKSAKGGWFGSAAGGGSMRCMVDEGGIVVNSPCFIRPVFLR